MYFTQFADYVIGEHNYNGLYSDLIAKVESMLVISARSSQSYAIIRNSRLLNNAASVSG